MRRDVSEVLESMKTFLLLFCCWSALRVVAQESLPTIRIVPEDVVQTSIERARSPLGMNKFVVRWKYTEPGAKKMLAFWRTHAGERVLEQVGEFESRPTISTAKPSSWTEEGWLRSRTDKFFAVSEEDAKRIVAGLKGK